MSNGLHNSAGADGLSTYGFVGLYLLAQSNQVDTPVSGAALSSVPFVVSAGDRQIIKNSSQVNPGSVFQIGPTTYVFSTLQQKHFAFDSKMMQTRLQQVQANKVPLRS